jgi:hypothetical protein
MGFAGFQRDVLKAFEDSVAYRPSVASHEVDQRLSFTPNITPHQTHRYAAFISHFKLLFVVANDPSIT